MFACFLKNLWLGKEQLSYVLNGPDSNQIAVLNGSQVTLIEVYQSLGPPRTQ